MVRSIYIGSDVLYTVSASKVRADSLGRMANLTRDAIASMATAGAAALWDAAPGGSLISEVELPHQMCGYGSYPLPIGPIVPVTLDARAGAAGGRRLQSVMACDCYCTSVCGLGGSTQMEVAREAMGL